MRYCTLALVFAVFVVCSTKAEPPVVNMLAFSSQGNITSRSAEALTRLTAEGAPTPTHIYVLSHGWNNTYADAMNSYQRILSHMENVADRYSLRPADYRPLVIGVYWPSKAGADESANRSISEDFHVGDARDVLDPALLANQVPALPPATWSSDVAAINELMSLPVEALTPGDYSLMDAVFKRYRLSPADGEGQRAQIFGGTVERGADLSPRDMLGLLSFWNKKELAGVVGKVGVGPMLSSLQSRFPVARMHLFGHSFGAKLMLSALASDAGGRPVSSVVLIQPAVSCLAFSPDGGYESTLRRVTGPLVATYSSFDRALALPYSAASRLAGQSSERSANGFDAMGSVGPDPSRFRFTRMVRPGASDMYVWDRSSPVGIDGSDFITGHSEFYNDATARLIWSVILDGDPASGESRSVEPDELTALVESARVASRGAVDAENPVAYLTKFSNAFQAGVKRSTGAAARGNGAVTLSLVPAAIADTGGNMFGRNTSSIVLTDRRSAENLRAIIDRNSLAREIIATGNDPHMSVVVRDLSEPQCVCVGWRRTAGFAAGRPLESGWNWLGSGCVVRASSGESVVVTAAHVKPALVPVGDVEFGVLLGDCFTNPREQKVVVAKRRVEHHDYDPSAHKNDIAVLRFAEALDLSGAEPFECGDVPTAIGESGHALYFVGFGSTDGTQRMAYDGFKRRVVLPLVPLEYDEGQASDFGLNNGLEFVAAKVGQGIDTCYGDSGGPAYVVEAGKKKLLGCILRGVKHSCGEGTIQLRVTRYLDFIDQCVQVE